MPSEAPKPSLPQTEPREAQKTSPEANDLPSSFNAQTLENTPQGERKTTFDLSVVLLEAREAWREAAGCQAKPLKPRLP